MDSQLSKSAHDAMIEVSLQAGARILSHFPLYCEGITKGELSSPLAPETKSDNPVDLVTLLDKSIEQQIQEFLRQRFPGIGFIGEEGGLTRPSLRPELGYFWIVDPIDGTTNFVHRFPKSCISIALVCKGVPIVGVIYEPIFGQLYTAIQGQGAFLNRSKRLFVSQTEALGHALVATEFGHSEWRHPELAQALAACRQRICELPVHGIRCMGSAALNLATVASGQFDLYYQYGIHAWDMAAGALIVTEAGGYVGSLFDDQSAFDLSRRNILACSSKKLFDGFREKILCGIVVREDAFDRDMLD